MITKILLILLCCMMMLSGCSSDVPLVLDESEYERPISNCELSDVPYLESFNNELQRVAAEIGIEPIEKLISLNLDFSDDEVVGETICTFGFKNKEVVYLGKFKLLDDEWQPMYILDAQTAEPYWAADDQEDDMFFKRSKMKN